jgi:NAD(P)-dependent dehydrogenase (short-subunit alcohol dehydrogenase family)
MTERSGRLAGRRVLVTGAASGMGEAIARLFAAEGARLALLDIAADALAAVASQTGQTALVCDVSSEGSVTAAVDRAVEALGGLDAVVNAAGVLHHGRFEETDAAAFARVVGVNLAGPYNVCRAALPHLRKAGGASIVNIASLSAVRPVPGMAVYSATKAGLLAMSEALSGEVGPQVRVNVICPGVIRTPMTQFMWGEGGPGDAGLARSIQVGRAGEPSDIAEAALFLTSDKAAFVNAANLLVTGGHVRAP